MLITREPVLRNFWYPVIPMEVLLSKGPQSFTLLGEKLVLWANGNGEPAAAEDRCCHRSAALSCGVVKDGGIQCPYHGWTFNDEGRCIKVPQGRGAISERYRIRAFACKQKYGYAWVCLGDPLSDIPDFPESNNKDYRFFPCFYEQWNTSSMRVMENELDMAHFAFVHTGTFGNPMAPNPLSLEITDLGPFSLRLKSDLDVVAAPEQARNTGMQQGASQRTMNITWYMPFTIKLEISYASGLHHVIINNSTPVADGKIQVVQFCFRNDREENVPQSQVLAFERRILNEDKAVLETTDPDVPLDPQVEQHMATDKAGIMLRKKFADLIQKHEATRPLS